MSIRKRDSHGSGVEQSGDGVPTERLRLPEQGVNGQGNGRRLVASESIGLGAFAAPEDPTLVSPTRAAMSAESGESADGPEPVDDAMPGAGDETVSTESSTPGLAATRVGVPDADDALQRGMRVFRRSAGRSKGVADAVYGRIQRVTQAEGAGESGLSHVLEMGAVINAGDLLVTLALANSLFFSVKPDEARAKVALYLLITMVPFTLLAPLIGPLLDRLRGGRRFAMAVTALTRALLCLVMAKTISGGGLALYPAAFGCLVAAKAYGVSRAAVIPRVLPPGSTLVRANSRISLTALASTIVATPIGAGLGAIGPQWTLGFAALIFFVGTWLCIRLPKVVDSNEGELKAQLRKRDHGPDAKVAESMPDRRLRSVGPSVLLALRANATLRAFSGFLSLFMAFLVRTHSLGGLKNLTAVGVFAAAVFVGSGLGSILGAWLKSRAPEGIITAAISLLAVTSIVTAFFYGLPMVLVLAAVAGLAPSLAKLSLDALIQRDTLERVRTSAFARSETLLQLSWVLGGALGLAMPASGVFGVWVGAVGVSVMALLTAKALNDLRSQSIVPREATS